MAILVLAFALLLGAPWYVLLTMGLGYFTAEYLASRQEKE